MRLAKGQRQLEWTDDLAELLWRQDRVLVTEPSELQALAELFPGSAGRPLDLNALNELLGPRGFAAAWDDEGLMFFRREGD